MFNFLNSAVLIAAAAALIPLLIHLFSKRKVKIVEFSSLRHLKEMQKRQVRKLKIRQLFLLILRILIILTAVLAFARPTTTGGYIGSHAGVSAAILLDRSASMQREVKDGRLFDLAKKSALDILDNFNQSDELILIPFDKEPYFSSGERMFSTEAAEKILNETNVGYHKTDLQTAYNKALGILNNSVNLNRELYLITDRQITSLPEKSEKSAAEFTTYIIDLPVETDGNNGITNIDMGGQLIEIGNSFQLKATVNNYDAFPKKELLASLFVDDIRVMQTEFAIDPLGEETITFTHTVYQPGWHRGWVEISDDGFQVNNRYYFTFEIPRQFNILIIDFDGSGEIIRLALIPSEKIARYWSVKTVIPDNLSTIHYNEYDVIILAGLSSLNQAESSRLIKFVDDGGGLFITTGAGLNKDFFNSNFADMFDINYEQSIPPSFEGAGYYSLENMDFTHPIFKAFGVLDRDSLPTIRFYTLPKISTGNQKRILASFSNNTVALVENGYGLGKMLLFNAPIGPRYSDLTAHSFFVPFIIRTMEYLAGSISEYEFKNFTGSSIIRSLPIRKYDDLDIADMITPDRRTFKIAGLEKGNVINLDCRPIDITGIYQLEKGSRTADVFPINLPLSEGNLSSASISELAASFKIDDYKIIPYSKPASATISTARHGRELWKVFLWAVVVLLLVEMLFSREKSTEEEIK
jgi:hypothetical protein